MRGAEKKETEKRDKEADEGRETVGRGKPLLGEGGQEKSGHRKFNTGGRKGKKGAQNVPGNTAENPVKMVEKGDEEAVEVGIDAGRGVAVAEKGVGLVGQREGEIGLQNAGVAVDREHRNAVEKVTGVDGERRKSGGKKGSAARKEGNADVLHRAGVHENAHREGPESAVTGGAEKNAEADAEEKITGENRKGSAESGAKELAVHRNTL